MEKRLHRDWVSPESKHESVRERERLNRIYHLEEKRDALYVSDVLKEKIKADGMMI